MNKKADIMGIVGDNVIYIILLILFFIGMLFFVYSKSNGANIYEDYYAKEIAKMIDMAKPGDDFAIDIKQVSLVAQKNKMGNYEEIFSFNNIKNEVCVKLTSAKGRCFSYFNNVSVDYDETGKFVHYAEPENRLHFVIKQGVPK